MIRQVARIAHTLRRIPTHLARLRLLLRARRALRAGSRRVGHGAAHGLPHRLVVSLTSYPPRFGGLHLTLQSLLQQTVRPDHLVLWIAHADIGRIPPKVQALAAQGVEIRACEDTRSYKKLVPAIETFPDASIVTADDDVYYPPDWLATLAAGVDPAEAVVVCHRVNRILREPDGALRPYDTWPDDVQDDAARRPSTDLMPIGVGGVLYPPNSLVPDVTDKTLFQKLAPDNDDLWFFWSARRADTRIKKVGGRFPRVTWPRSQRGHLFSLNQFGGNDRQIADLIAAFGVPGSRGMIRNDSNDPG